MNVLREAAKQVPGIVALVVLVVFFIRDGQTRTESFVQFVTARDDHLRELGDSCHTQQEQLTDSVTKALEHASEVIERNTEAMGHQAAVVHQVERTLERLIDRMNRVESGERGTAR